MIEVPELGDHFHAMWVELIELTESRPAPWTLIGAHMVTLLGWQRGREQVRPSKDADILINVWAVTDRTLRMSETLRGRGYELEGISPEGIGHRFVKEGVSIDVLGPDGLGERANLSTAEGAHTVRVPGGTQALLRSHDVRVRTRSRDGVITVPNLLGAILVKIRAIEVDDQPEAQRQDVAFLLSLVEDPDLLAADLSFKERTWLRHHVYLADPKEKCYRGILNASDAAIVYRRLADVTEGGA